MPPRDWMRPPRGGRSARLGNGLDDGRLRGGFRGTGLVRGTGLLWGISGVTRHVTAGVNRAGTSVAAGSLTCPHPPQRGDTNWYSVAFGGWRRLHIHYLATDPRGLSGAVQPLLTPGTVIWGDLERLIRVLDQTP